MCANIFDVAEMRVASAIAMWVEALLDLALAMLLSLCRGSLSCCCFSLVSLLHQRKKDSKRENSAWDVLLHRGCAFDAHAQGGNPTHHLEFLQ